MSQPRRSRRPLLVALLVFSLAWVIRAPLGLATLLLPPGLEFKNVDGSLWNGSASAIGLGHLIVQERVTWHWRAQALLSGKLEWQVTGRFGERISTLSLGLGADGAALTDVSVYLPLEPFAALHPKLRSLRIGALLHASAASSRLPTVATLQVDGLFSPQVPQSGALGSYLVDLKFAPDGVGQWALRSLSGVLAASGQGKIDVRRGQLTGRLLVNPSTPLPGLSPALAELPHSDAGYLIAF